MPVIHTNLYTPNSSIHPKNDQLFGFSSILRNKYPHGRSTRVASGSVNDKSCVSSNSVQINSSHPSDVQPKMDAWTLESAPISKVLEKANLSTKKICNIPQFVLFLIPLAMVLVAIGITAAVFGTVYRNQTSSTTTMTTTTVTTATTTTSTTTSTTSTSTSTTSTTSETTTTTTSTTTSVTTVTTVSTTTVTTQTTTTVTGGCYYGGDSVNLIEGGQRRIDRLQVNDRIWTLSPDGQQLIEDEVLLMMHSEPNISTYFYTFTTIDGHSISLTGSHYILVISRGQRNPIPLRASNVTLDHQLIMHNRRIEIKTIEIHQHMGFYSPFTWSGYLLVNNISTSVFTDNYRVRHDQIYQVFLPIRLYYRITKCFFGSDYDPFSTRIKYGLHPLIALLKTHQKSLRVMVILWPYLKNLVFITTVLFIFQRIFVSDVFVLNIQ